MVVSINLNSSTWAAINQHRHFCVNVLRADQMAIAERFAGRGGLKGSARYEGASWSALATGALALEDSLAAVDCTSRTRLCATATRSSSAASGMWSAESRVLALIYHHGAYGSS
ncbi:MAG: flavin reductase [Mesorhizobium sp.]|nr:MAG: flavin reductase [Mesorhizobium sp.]